MKVLIPCSCGKPSEFEYDKISKLTDSVINDILSGEFLSTKCSSCGKVLRPDFSVRFKDEEKNIDILYISEKERDNYLRGKGEHIYKKPNRIVIGFSELAEKIRIMMSDLDDIVIESVKYYILSKIENDNKLENEVYIYFNRINDDKLIFEIHGLNEEEVGFLPIEKNFYNMNRDKLEENIKSEPFKTILEPPYISLFKVYREYKENKME